MNYLAHLYLSGSNKDILLGNFIADGIKGEDRSNYKKGVLQGISLHKKIDDFTDKHEMFKQSTRRLNSKYGHYAWVIVDIYYDHFLAKYWEEYHNENLDVYASGIYRLLSTRHDELPKQSQRFLWYMKEYNILFNYSKLEGISLVLNGLSRRARFESKMEESIDDLKAMYTDFESDFREFFPQLEKFVKKQEEYQLKHTK
ncbi:MAG: acyl carrier protein phosphodiesterase [Flavobacteriales bacterium]|nr:acyl carrier protein phosphodiesterase [Flavobacteriales bacterium]